ncbi:TfoX/Sxy family DNA transformation protein [Salmonella enterica]|uniref:Crp/Fnr family transcriptional regulator n=3 Tax=Salmonella enterica TaxID=28901 RepID=A0A5W7Z0U8_SALDE|nr:TfoX/Sxy family DNA transformation protein [Salmonella enterica]EAB6710336.1 Crp/Fnr family transcriptional regulator [Salmonella enterica subsp. enterica serovar Tokoin]EAC0959172.1 TfoX family DNA transformation protein [Salmonella enterica subsp. enterica]EBS4937052.1 Crp/Fnr family transcriptional regulator [Salmonella enterica subsp. enterica serovar Goverdhan]EBW5537144.1 Crp/Fnr family transcriptional regulator [Salmonella enterica subsp. enterica serovar Pasing]ECD0708038.1 TfoX fam
MRALSYDRIYKSQEYLASLGTIQYRSLFGSYSLTVEDTVFAMVANGELYLRACEESVSYCVKHPPAWLMFMKCGRPVMLNYYRVDESLWRDQQQLVRLSKYSLDAAMKEKHSRILQHRLKDLPNMTFHLETLLNESGIKDENMLRILGAKMCWLRLRQSNPLLTVKVLYALEGAIVGVHEAALPASRRQELADWAHSLTAG